MALEACILGYGRWVAYMPIISRQSSNLLIVVAGEGTQSTNSMATTKLISSYLRNEAASIASTVALTQSLAVKLLLFSSVRTDLSIGVDTWVCGHAKLVNRSINKW